MVAPGQASREPAAAELLEKLPKGEVVGIVNVAAYGYHAFPGNVSFQEDGAYAEGLDLDAFMAAYLVRRREDELRRLEALVPYLARVPDPIWFMTFVTKQDLWWDRRRDVEAHYETGPYATVLRSLRARLPEGRFRFDTAYGAVTWENFVDGQHELLAPTVSGYDHRIRARNLARFGNGLAQFMGVQP